MRKKAQGLSINTIIIAAIAIIVMIILILVFTGRFQGFNAAAQDCESLGGTCVVDSNQNRETDKCDGELERVTLHHCEPSSTGVKRFCCMKI